MNKITELREFFAQRSTVKISFWSENQADYSDSDPCRLHITFDRAIVSENPNIICLKRGQDSVTLSRVKAVRSIDNSSPLGTIIMVVCGNRFGQEEDKLYTLIAS